MGASRTLLRKLDLDLIARIEASGRIVKTNKAAKLRKPRNGESYRAARRNEARRTQTTMVRLIPPIEETPHDGSIELNRSREFPRAQSYTYAREIAPSAEPVR